MPRPLQDPSPSPTSGHGGLAGLSGSEAATRRRRGEVNRAAGSPGQAYGYIVRRNVLNLYNGILFTVGAGLLALGRYNDALISAGIGVLNAVISTVQEIRARRRLERLQAQGRRPVVVVRDGRDVDVAPGDVVRGDVVRVRPGDQVVVDGPVLDGALVVEESSIAGAPGTQRRATGQTVLSGSRCVGGGGSMLARDVGGASHAGRLAAGTHRSTTEDTPLQRQVAFCIRAIMLLVALLSGAILAQAGLEGLPVVRVVQITAVLSGLVPYGLFLLIVLAYTAGAVASSRRGALVQRINAVDSLSNVDVVCTGTAGIAPGTVAGFSRHGVAVVVLSGDDPEAVAARAHLAGMPDPDPVHGEDLDGLTDAQLDALVAGASVFAHLASGQKERIVTSLRRQGRYVAMVGDGVDDVPALQAAHVGVAMGSGSAVARDLAGVVLLDDSLEALLPTRQEGRRIIAGIAISAQLFLARVVTQALIIVVVAILGLGFPYTPAQTGLTLFTVGLPSVFLTAWARPDPPDRHLLRTFARFVLPAAVVTAGFAVAVYASLYSFITEGLSDPDLRRRVVAEFEQHPDMPAATSSAFAEAAATLGAQTGLSTFVSLASILLILFLAPPSPVFAVWTRSKGDKRPALLVVALLTGVVAAFVVPTLSTYFGLTRPAPPVYEVVLPTLGLWFIALAATYRFRLLDRALGLRTLPDP